MVIWMIGLAGSGKTTVGRALYERMKMKNPATVFLDGDHVREIMGDDLGHTIEDRERNGRRICNLCHYFDSQGIDVVACVLSLFHEQQDWNREHLTEYFEVFIDVPMAVLEERDQKQLYSGARAGQIKNVAGIDIPFTPPKQPNLVIENGAFCDDFSSHVNKVLSAISARRGETS
ncbi:adenylyl-sulfate kinase [Magnetovibrio blakemorei]|uniref:Adenylyl-sulfate kinase n=1 Tax=Magnetovibrio blakemorei TaxID=28181 RepID=A0A1E5QBY3_9PROT|nr:adenylyl-sulfate kinase [Magnetovibrio blakemorei]OEJ69562.1 adenylyl-sulfate kinase [Magnetovibrio blakemorei]